jgi:hypothetical protein
MEHYIPHAYLKTIDAEEVREYTKNAFKSALAQLKYREVKKSDRTLYFVSDNAHVDGIRFFRDDYFEVLGASH